MSDTLIDWPRRWELSWLIAGLTTFVVYFALLVAGRDVEVLLVAVWIFLARGWYWTGYRRGRMPAAPSIPSESRSNP